MAEQPSHKSAKSYSKRPLWRWVLIYVVVAIIVYGLVYLSFIHKSSGTGMSTY